MLLKGESMIEKEMNERIMITQLPVDGRFTNWGNFSPCSVTCGGGSQTRSRSCTSPPPSNGGQDCVGARTQTESCNSDACPGTYHNNIRKVSIKVFTVN